MQAIIERCCGLDVHQETVVACLLIGAAGARARKEVRTFRTVRRELEALRDWLKAAGVTHVGMESTGVYWRPVYAVLEGHVELIVGNARHIRNVPGRKTDVKDAEWIADLVRHGLIVPGKRRRREDYRRWERGRSMELWQMDVMGGVHLADQRLHIVETGNGGSECEHPSSVPTVRAGQGPGN